MCFYFNTCYLEEFVNILENNLFKTLKQELDIVSFCEILQSMTFFVKMLRVIRFILKIYILCHFYLHSCMCCKILYIFKPLYQIPQLS